MSKAADPIIRVPMREISQAETPASMGAEINPPIYVYDCSGPYTDPAVKIDIRSGLAALREGWIAERGDTETLDKLTSEYGQQRLNDPELAEMRFNLRRAPRKAKPGKNVTQMHYARAGIITPEMEYIAIRENQRREGLVRDDAESSIPAKISAQPCPNRSRRNSCAAKWPQGAPSSRPTSTIPKPSR